MKQYLGQWWKSSAPDRRFFGTLTLRELEVPILDLHNDNDIDLSESFLSVFKPDIHMVQWERGGIVHGEAQCGQRFTLYDGLIRNANIGMGGVTTTSIYFNHGFEGACIETPTTLPVERISMRYPGLDAWLEVSPFDVKHDKGGMRVTISHEKPESESFRIDDERKLIFAWTRKGPNLSRVQTRIHMQVLPWIEIAYDTPVTPDKASEDAHVIGELLSMFLGAPTTTRQVSMRSPNYTLDFEGESHSVDLRALGAPFSLPQSFCKWTSFDVLLPFSLVRQDFEKLVQKWFELRQNCWGVIVPYLAYQRSPTPLADGRFFDFASVAESLHRHLRTKVVNFKNKEASQIRKKILSCVPDHRRKSFCEALLHVNDLTFKERLQRLLDRFPDLTIDVIGDQQEQDDFCKLVKDLRNREAHRMRPTDKTDISGMKLIRIALKLKVIIDAWILVEMGLTENVVMKAMRENRSYWHNASCKSWPWDIA